MDARVDEWGFAGTIVEAGCIGVVISWKERARGQAGGGKSFVGFWVEDVLYGRGVTSSSVRESLPVCVPSTTRSSRHCVP